MKISRSLFLPFLHPVRRAITGASALVTLALWYMRHVWRLFLFLIAGMIASALLVCSLPLFSQVNATASIQSNFTNSNLDPYSYVQATNVKALSSHEIALGGQKLAEDYQRLAGTFFHAPPDRLIQSDNLPVSQNNQPVAGQLLQLHGYDINHIASHLHRLEGRLPRPSQDGLEIALTQSNAQALHARVGSTFTISATATPSQNRPLLIPIKLTVVGIYEDVSFFDPFWHTDVLTSYADPQTQTIYNHALVSDHELLALLDRLSRTNDNLPISLRTMKVSWYFPLDIAAVTQNNIPELIQQLISINIKVPSNQDNPFHASSLQVNNRDLQSALQVALAQGSVSQVPVITLLILMLGLLLFFVNFIVELLVNRQAETMALSRNRGATLRQILLIFVTQSLLLGLATLLVTPALVVPIVRFLVLVLFPINNQGALNALPADPVQTVLALGWYLLASVGIAVLTMCLAVWRTLRSSTLGRGSTPGAGTQRPAWQRFYVDLILLILGGLTWWFENYMISTSIIDARLQVTLAGPCMLAAATLLFLGGVLLVLRAFPVLMSLAARLTARRRGLVPQFSFVMMARMPRQSLRTVLLLIFTIAFTLFSLVFMATQTQRVEDLASYAAGADFSGTLNRDTPYDDTMGNNAQAVADSYRHIPGVLAATTGYSDDFPFNKFAFTLRVLAVDDPQSFISSMIWPQEDNPRALEAPARRMVAQRATFLHAQQDASLPPLPAIVDETTKNQLHLSVSQTFQMNAVGGSNALQLVVVGEVKTLPGTSDAPLNRGKILVDYQSFFYAYRTLLEPAASLTQSHVWLHTLQDAASLKTVRRALTSEPLKLDQFNDRLAIIQGLQHDPLYLNLTCTLTLGIILALLLAWAGNLIAAWQYVRGRLRGLATLRALGVTSGQLATLVGWEQSIVCATAIVLGGLGGLFFITLTLSSLIFSGNVQVDSIRSLFASDIFLMQFTPPLHIVIPPVLFIAFAVVIALCLITVVIISVMGTRLALAQTLRLSEDYLEETPLFVAQTPESGTEQATATARDARRHPATQGSLLGGSSMARALTPLRRSWGYLLLTELGIMLAILLSCVVPLFSQVASTAGLHEVLLRPENRSASTISNFIQIMPLQIFKTSFENATRDLNQAFLVQTKSYFHAPPVITLNSIGFTHGLEQAQHPGPSSIPTTSTLSLQGFSEATLSAQGQIIQGHMPRRDNTVLQIALTPTTATFLHVRVGDVLRQQFNVPLTMQVVGLFTPKNPADFKPWPYDAQHLDIGYASALVSGEGLVESIDAFAHTQADNTWAVSGSVTWRYAIDSTSLTSSQLDAMIAAFTELQTNPIVHSEETMPISAPALPLNALKQYQQSITVSQIPILTTSALILGLILLFLALMAELLVEREASTIALLRSRGATRRQVFSAFLGRTLLLNGIGLLGGLLLVLPTVTLLTRLMLHTNDQSALHILSSQPLLMVGSVWIYALGSIAATLAALTLALYLATGMDYLAQRREETRATRRPLWQRFYLDVVGIVIAIGAYNFLRYLTNAGLLDPQVNVLVKAPLVLATSVCLVLGCMLLFLRLFPLLLRLGTMLATRNKGVAPMLALSQMALAPRQTLRIALLLILTTAFVIFASVFSSSQSQHTAEMAAYWAGADFSGSLTTPIPGDQAGALRKQYLRIPGVISVASGATTTFSGAVAGNGDANIIAVDLKSFMQTVIWPEMSTPEQQNRLLDEFNVTLASVSSTNSLNAISGTTPIIPAIVDSNTWEALSLEKGQTFTIAGISFIAVDQVSHIPTTGTNTQPIDATSLFANNSTTFTSGILTDYQSFAQAMQSIFVQGNGNFTNYIWLKTDGQPHSLENVRKALSSGPLKLALFYDLQATIQMLNTAPLTLNLVGILILGALTPLALSWIGCLTASWVHIRQRHLLFGILRALGSTPRQLGRVLLWEQALVYGAAVVMGTLFGLLTALLALPALLLTSTVPGVYAQGTDGAISTGVGNTDIFSLQNVLPTHVVMAPSLALVIALLALLGALTVLLMRHSITRVALAPTLRLNQD